MLKPIINLLPWSKKKGQKYSELYGYDNLRHNGYPTTSPALAPHHHPHLQQFQPHIQQHQVHQHPPHSLAHKHYTQQIIMQSPQPPAYINQPHHHQPQQLQHHQVAQPTHQMLATNQQQLQMTPHLTHQQSAVASTNQCSCHQCSMQANQNQQVQQYQQQINMHSSLVSPNHASPMNPHNTANQNAQALMFTGSNQAVQHHQQFNLQSHHHHQQQQQQLPQAQQYQQQLSPTPTNLDHSTQQNMTALQSVHAQQSTCQHQQQQQPDQHCHNPTSEYHNPQSPQNGFTNYQAAQHQHQQQNQYQHQQQVPTTQTSQCICMHHCVFQQHSHQQQNDCSHMNYTNSNCPQQIISGQDNVLNPQLSAQVMPSSTSTTCAPQMNNSGQSLIPMAPVPQTTTPMNQAQINRQNQNVPYLSQYQPTQVVSQHLHQQQSDPILIQNNQQHNQFHTIQPNQYQHVKQQLMQPQNQTMQPPQQHQRIQSMHHQQFQPNQTQQYTHQTIQMMPYSQSDMQIPAYQNQQSLDQELDQSPYSNGIESNMNESSRYANMPIRCEHMKESPQKTTTSSCSQSTKFEDHVYCNQNQKFLPPYYPPPSYKTFMDNRRMYLPQLANDHNLTCRSESLLMQRTKDSGYENLKETYYNFAFERQETGLTS